MDAFANQLENFKQGKGYIQFPFDQPLLKELIMDIVKYRRNELLQNDA